MSEWQPIETAPKDETKVLVWDRHNGHDVAWFGWADKRGDVWFNGDVCIAPSHWMPLPLPPSVARKI